MATLQCAALHYMTLYTSVSCRITSQYSDSIGSQCSAVYEVVGPWSPLIVTNRQARPGPTHTHCTARHWTALYETTEHCTAIHCTSLHCNTLHISALQYTAHHCTAIQIPALRCCTNAALHRLSFADFNYRQCTKIPLTFLHSTKLTVLRSLVSKVHQLLLTKSRFQQEQNSTTKEIWMSLFLGCCLLFVGRNGQ